MPGERILLVDDNAVTLKLARVLLELERYDVATAATAEEALSIVDEVRPHLILTDVRLPGIDGLELTRRLRAREEWRTVPIIALTGLNSAQDERDALDAGCNAWLSKPVQSQVLRGLVRRYLDNRAQASVTPVAIEDVVASLRVEFLTIGAEQCRTLLAMLPTEVPADRSLEPLFDYKELRRALHNWSGAGGTFGLSEITEKAREAEALLKKPFDRVAVALRRVMETLQKLFAQHLAAAAGAAESPKSPAPALETTGRKPVILACDDDPLVLAVVRSTLEASGMTCRTAGGGRQAFKMVTEDRPDALVLDINMPAFDGFRVLDELRQTDGTRDLKVMLLTALGDPADIARGVEHGADDYMVKPFDPANLVERLKMLLDG